MSEEEKYTIEMTREEIDALLKYFERGTKRPAEPSSDYKKTDVIIYKLKERLGKIRDSYL